MNRKATAVIVGLCSVILLSSCASSKRMSRMSGGVFGDSFLPDYKYIEDSRQSLPSKMIERKKFEMTAGIDDSLINIWPFFYRNRNYFSFFWPLIDYDNFGYAVRPFLNKEGNEYAALFPLSGWNTANQDGWILNSYWSRYGYGSVPLFHMPGSMSKPESFSYVLLYWRDWNRYGIFPFLWAKKGNSGYFNLFPFFFHNRNRDLIPLLFYHSDNFLQILLYYNSYGKDGLELYGVFPLLWAMKGDYGFFNLFPLYFHNKERDFVPYLFYNSVDFLQILLYYRHRNGMFGVMPLFHIAGEEEGINFIFPAYWIKKRIYGTIIPFTFLIE